MNSKFIVPLETAKQLKAKGYPQWDTDYVYEISTGDRYIRVMVDENEDVILAAPTYHEAVDWLFTMKKCPIMIEVNQRYIDDVYVFNPFVEYGELKMYTKYKNYSTREGALNSAILQALEVI